MSSIARSTTARRGLDESASSKKRLIINADDFGLSIGVNNGIIRTHEHGVVTSTSLMVRAPAAREAAEYARSNRSLSVGLHIDLGEWEFKDGDWLMLYEVVPLDDRTAVKAEIRRQVDTFISLIGRPPTHLDSHQHVHRREPILSDVLNIASELKAPLRGVTPEIRYCGDFYGQTVEGSPYPEGISTERLLSIIAALGPGVTEVSCHPGDDPSLKSIYRTERIVEATTLCDPRVRAAIESQQIDLASYNQL